MLDPRTDTRLFEGRGLLVLYADCHKTGEDWYEPPTLEITLPRRGLFVAKSPSREVVADVNHAVAFRTGRPTRIGHPFECGDESTVMRLEGELVDRVAARWPGLRGEGDSALAYGQWPTSSRTFSLHRSFLDLARGPDGLEKEEAAFELLGSALGDALGPQHVAASAARDEPRPSTRRAHREKVSAIKILMHSNPKENWSIAKLAGLTGISPSHLSLLFRRETGLSIHRYLKRLRLRVAAERLCLEEVGIASLATELGFVDHSHLTNAFRQEFGLSPRQFRERHQAPRR